MEHSYTRREISRKIPSATAVSASTDTRSGNVKKTRRARPSPNANARNLSIEKQRREAMNKQLLEMARLVPSLACAPRLNKVVIVNKTVEHLQEQRNMCVAAGRDMHDLLAENRRLVSEISALRIQFGAVATSPIEPRAITPAMARLMAVENEVLGTFPAGFEDSRTAESVERLHDGNEAVMAERDFPLLMGDFVPSLGQASFTSMTQQNESNTPWAAPPELIPTSWLQESEISWDSVPWLCDTTEGYVA